jgi:zinc and cadmium transporter
VIALALAVVWRGALLSVGIVSAIPLICLVFVARGRWASSISHHLMSLAAGALLASAVFELIPEAVARLGSRTGVAAYVALGFAGFLAIERLIHFHLRGPATSAKRRVRPYVLLNLFGVTLHNAIDGMIIAVSFTAGIDLGIGATIAIVLHEIPHEIGNFGVFVHGGVPPVRAVLLNVFLALAAIAGTIVALIAGSRSVGVAAALLPVAAGNFIYVATVDLIPELRRELTPRGRRASVAMMVGGGTVTMLPLLIGR